MEKKDSEDFLENEEETYIPLESWSDYKLKKLIAKGGYAEVWEAQHLPSKTDVAIKMESVNFSDSINCKRILREMKLLRQLKHPNIVKLIDVLLYKKNDEEGVVYLVLEKMYADVWQLIKDSPSISEKQIKTIFYNLLLGLKFLEASGVLHRDIKPANILITNTCLAKLCDFGLARTIFEVSSPSLEEAIKPTLLFSLIESLSVKESLTSSNEDDTKSTKYRPFELSRRLTTCVVTKGYKAPEVILMQKDYSHAIDVWAAGCIFAELQSAKKENMGTCKSRTLLFPVTRNSDDEDQSQLMGILEVIGSPTIEDCKFISEKDLISKLMSLPKQVKKDFSVIYPGSDKKALDLLDKMLQFNPYKRLTVGQCLEHPYFADIRKKEKEVCDTKKIILEFPEEDKLTVDSIRKLFLDEASYFEKLKKEGLLYVSK